MEPQLKSSLKEMTMSLSNKTIQQDLDTLFLLVKDERYKEAKDKINKIRKALNTLDGTVDVLIADEEL